MTTALALMEDTVVQETCITLAPPETMTDDELAGVVIQAFAKIQPYLPYIIALKKRFVSGDRNSDNRLLAPIRGCYSWKEFCTSLLNRSPEAIRQALAAEKEKQKPRQLTDVAVYEQEHPDIWNIADNLLAQMSAADAVGALVGMDVPPLIAEAIMRRATGADEREPAESVESALSPMEKRAEELTVLARRGFCSGVKIEETRTFPDGFFDFAAKGVPETLVRAMIAAALASKGGAA